MWLCYLLRRCHGRVVRGRHAWSDPPRLVLLAGWHDAAGVVLDVLPGHLDEGVVNVHSQDAPGLESLPHRQGHVTHVAPDVKHVLAVKPVWVRVRSGH